MTKIQETVEKHAMNTLLKVENDSNNMIKIGEKLLNKIK